MTEPTPIDGPSDASDFQVAVARLDLAQLGFGHFRTYVARRLS